MRQTVPVIPTYQNNNEEANTEYYEFKRPKKTMNDLINSGTSLKHGKVKKISIVSSKPKLIYQND